MGYQIYVIYTRSVRNYWIYLKTLDYIGYKLKKINYDGTKHVFFCFFFLFLGS